jgi:hypothetical protein
MKKFVKWIVEELFCYSFELTAFKIHQGQGWIHQANSSANLVSECLLKEKTVIVE